MLTVIEEVISITNYNTYAHILSMNRHVHYLDRRSSAAHVVV